MDVNFLDLAELGFNYWNNLAPVPKAISGTVVGVAGMTAGYSTYKAGKAFIWTPLAFTAKLGYKTAMLPIKGIKWAFSQSNNKDYKSDHYVYLENREQRKQNEFFEKAKERKSAQLNILDQYFTDPSLVLSIEDLEHTLNNNHYGNSYFSSEGASIVKPKLDLLIKRAKLATGFISESYQLPELNRKYPKVMQLYSVVQDFLELNPSIEESNSKIETWEEKYYELSDKYTDLEENHSSLYDEYTKLLNEYSTVTQRCKTLTDENKELRDTCSNLQRQLDNRILEFNHNTKMLEYSEKKVQNQTKELRELNERYSKFIKENSKLQDQLAFYKGKNLNIAGEPGVINSAEDPSKDQSSDFVKMLEAIYKLFDKPHVSGSVSDILHKYQTNYRVVNNEVTYGGIKGDIVDVNLTNGTHTFSVREEYEKLQKTKTFQKPVVSDADIYRAFADRLRQNLIVGVTEDLLEEVCHHILYDLKRNYTFTYDLYSISANSVYSDEYFNNCVDDVDVEVYINNTYYNKNIS